LSIICAITALVAATALADDDLRTGVGIKELCQSSQHPYVCEELIESAYANCRQPINNKFPSPEKVDTCAVAILVQDLADIRGTFNMTILNMERPGRYLIGPRGKLD